MPSFLLDGKSTRATRVAVPGSLRNRTYDLYLVACNVLLALPGHRFRNLVLRVLARFSVGSNVAVQRGVRITSRGGVQIGDGCQINRDVTLDGRGGLELGRFVNVSPEAAFLTADHDPHSPVFAGRNRAVTVGDRAWIATRAIILPGTTVGAGAVVAAGAVVHGDVPPWSTWPGTRRRSSPIVPRTRSGPPGPPTEDSSIDPRLGAAIRNSGPGRGAAHPPRVIR